MLYDPAQHQQMQQQQQKQQQPMQYQHMHHEPDVSSLAAGHLTLVPALRKELDAMGREDLMIVVGGVIPSQDFDDLRAAGADAIYPPGTVIATAAISLIDTLRARLDAAVRAGA